MVTKQDLPDELGRYGNYGGRFVPETLMPAIHELEIAYKESQTCLLYTSPSPRD